jgi:flagellar motor protein MotB
MIRNLIIGLSILFFVFSSIIIFKALGIPVKNTRYLKDHEGITKENLSPEEDISGQFTKERATNQALVGELLDPIADLKDKQSKKTEETRANVEAEGSKGKARVLAVLGQGSFLPGQIVINENLMNPVKKLIPDILATPDHRVIIEGHTDNTPPTPSPEKPYKDNMELSFLRAQAVASILVKHGISNERISAIGYGNSRPIASNETDEGRVKNRRVEIKLILGGKEF